MFYLIECYNGELVKKGENFEEVRRPALEEAECHNCGMFRVWFQEGQYFIDAGRITYKIIGDSNAAVAEIEKIFYEEMGGLK